MNEELYEFSHHIMAVLFKQMDAMAHDSCSASTPEVCAKLFECVSLLIKEQPKLATEYDTLRQYYGQVLGHSTGFVREYAASAFSIALAQLNIHKLGKHYRKIVKALASSNKLLSVNNNEMNNQVDFINKFDINIILYHAVKRMNCYAKLLILQ